MPESNIELLSIDVYFVKKRDSPLVGKSVGQPPFDSQIEFFFVILGLLEVFPGQLLLDLLLREFVLTDSDGVRNGRVPLLFGIPINSYNLLKIAK